MDKLIEEIEEMLNLYLLYIQKNGVLGLIEFFDVESEKNLENKIKIFKKCTEEDIPLEKLKLNRDELIEILELYPKTKIWD